MIFNEWILRLVSFSTTSIGNLLGVRRMNVVCIPSFLIVWTSLVAANILTSMSTFIWQTLLIIADWWNNIILKSLQKVVILKYNVDFSTINSDNSRYHLCWTRVIVFIYYLHRTGHNINFFTILWHIFSIQYTKYMLYFNSLLIDLNRDP